MPWSLLYYQHMVQIRTELQQAGKSANTINLTLSACRGVMKACFSLGLVKADQLMFIKEVKRVREFEITIRTLLNSTRDNSQV